MSNALPSQHPFFCFPFRVSFFFLLLSPPPAVPTSSKFTLGRALCCQATSGLFCTLVPWAETNADKHTGKYTHAPLHTERHSESPFVLFLTALCTAATFYWWLPTANSKVSLSFDFLICIGSLSQHDSGYQCPQAECQCLFSAYKYPPDLVCHVYSWTSLTFDNTLGISLSKFHIAFSLIKYRHAYALKCPSALQMVPSMNLKPLYLFVKIIIDTIIINDITINPN